MLERGARREVAARLIELETLLCQEFLRIIKLRPIFLRGSTHTARKLHKGPCEHRALLFPKSGGGLALRFTVPSTRSHAAHFVIPITFNAEGIKLSGIHSLTNYFAPHWVQYDSFKLHNYGEMVDFPPLEKKSVLNGSVG